MDDYDQHAYWLGFNLGTRLARHQANLSLSDGDGSKYRHGLIDLLAQVRDGEITMVDPEEAPRDKVLSEAHALAIEAERKVAARILNNHFERMDDLERVTEEAMEERKRRQENKAESDSKD